MGYGGGGGFTPSNNNIEGEFRASGSNIQLSSSELGLSGILSGTIAGPGSFLGLTPQGRIVFTTPAAGGGDGDVEAGSTFTTAGVIMACDGDDKTIDEPGTTLTTNSQGLTVSGITKVGASAGSGQDLFAYTAGTAAHVGLQWDADGETEGILIGGADDHGVDFKFFGESAGKFVQWDMSGDELVLGTSAKLSFHDAGGGENIIATSNGHLEINAGTTLDATAPTVDVNASTAVTIDGPAVTVADSASGKPVLTLKTTNTTSGTSSELQFLKDAADTEDGEVLGQISFYGEDEGNNNTHFANIKASISESDQTDEAGKLEFQVAESNGTTTAMTTGLTLEGEHATDGQIDVTIAAGADSTTTIAGDLEVTTDLKVSGDTSLHNEGSNCLLTLEGLAGANSAIQFKETNHYWSMGHRGSDNAFFIRDSLSTTGDIIQIEENAGDNLIYAKAGSLLGINTDAPTDTLTVAGSIYVSTTAHVIGAVTLGNTLLVTGSIGGAGLSISNNDEGTSNTILGSAAGAAVASGCNNNVLIGHEAGNDLSAGDENVFIGYQAGDVTTAAGECVVIGSLAGGAIMTTDADGSVFIGKSAGAAITTGQYNTAVGYNALDVDVAGDGSTAVGYQALTAQTGTDGTVGATAVGYLAGKMNESGISSTFLGWKSGPQSPGSKLTGDNNTSVGAEAGGALAGAGHSNTFVGSQAGLTTTTGVENTCLGFNADIQDATATNQIVIGNNITGTKDNAVFIGNDTSHIENDYNSDATWNHSSDVRQKTGIRNDTLGLSFINNIRPVTYQHKSPSEFPKEWTAYNPNDTTPMGGGKTIHGFIAQEIKQALDIEGVTTFGGWSVGPDGRQSMSFDALVMPLVNAVKELSAKVKELENTLDSE